MDEDEDTYCKFGTPLPAYEDDEIPAKKPVSVEDQIVLDVNGKRRFHGAFTGGFSAGYWNTVGSEEGWKPTEFKSSRKEKAAARTQNPMDFMDDEDLGEFGIAPQRVQTKDDFAHSSKTGGKRRLDVANWSGSIPGVPVLKTLLEPAKEKTAVRILKNMGWREGQGIGERQSKAEKQKTKSRNKKELYVMKMYGCELPGSEKASKVSETDSDVESDDVSDYEVTFAPDDFYPLLTAFKDNSFGLGYSGLDRRAVGAQRFNLFDTLEIVDRNNKKLSIRGQAFGVGALEDDDDEDVYSRDDMSRYDFSLEDKSKKPAAIKSSAHLNDCIEGFCPSRKTLKGNKKVFRVNVPDSFTPRNWLQRRTRFEPLDELQEQRLLEERKHKIQGLGRHDLDPEKRAQALGERPIEKVQVTKNTALLDLINKRCDSFVSGNVLNPEVPKSDTPSYSQVKCEEKSKNLRVDIKSHVENLGSTKEGFKPFIADPEKQERYEKFLAFKPSEKLKTREEYLNTLQPLGMSLWDREREFKEFEQAQRMYKPLDGLMSDRFVTESSLIAEKEQVDPAKAAEVKMKRKRTMWKPHKDLCKRFNVEEPFGGMMDEEKIKPKTKFSVFDYLEAPVNRKSDFVTPVVIPKRIEENEHKASEPVPIRVSAKDFFVDAETPSTSYEPERSTENISRMQPINPIKPVKRTDLEQKVLASVNKKPEEKKDLFKSIFCSSDEELETDEKRSDSNPPSMNDTEKMKLVESLVAIKPASHVNVLRNNSPPRGIFKSIFDIKRPENEAEQMHPMATIVESEDSSSTSDGDPEEDAFYGPKLPSIRPSTSTSQSTQLDTQLQEMIRKTGSSKKIVEEWIEKQHVSSKKSKKKKSKEHKKSKKHKKEKKKHKHKERR